MRIFANINTLKSSKTYISRNLNQFRLPLQTMPALSQTLFIILLLSVTAIGNLSAKSLNPVIKANLDVLNRLDTIIANHPRYVEAKENKLRQLKESLKRATYYHLKEYQSSLSLMYMKPNDDWRQQQLKDIILYRDSLSRLPVTDNPEWMWVPLAKKVERRDNNIDKDYENRLRQAVENNSEPSRAMATNAYWLSRYYKNIGDEKLMIEKLDIDASGKWILVPDNASNPSYGFKAGRNEHLPYPQKELDQNHNIVQNPGY